MLHRFLNRALFICFLIHCGQVFAESEINMCLSGLEANELELYNKTKGGAIHIEYPVFPRGLEAFSAMEKGLAGSTDDVVEIACVSMRFNIDPEGKAKNITVINEVPPGGFVEAALKALEMSTFGYDVDDCSAGLYIYNYKVEAD